MNRIERAAERDPGLFAFGTRPLKRLSAAEERDAPFEDRLRSVWSYIVERSARFATGLSVRERAHLDSVDLVQEVVVSLLEKDHKWDIAKGRYVTFCEAVMRNVLSVQLEQARVVGAPANAHGRLKEYHRREAAGTLGKASRLTMRAIEAALGEVDDVGPVCEPVFGGDRDTSSPETPADTVVTRAIRSLADPGHALVLGKTYGLFGGEEQTAREIAAATGGDPKQVQSLQGRAKTAIRKRIEKLRGGQ